MSLDSLLAHRCTVRRLVEAIDRGNVTVTETSLATDVPCLVQEGAGRVQEMGFGGWLEYSAVVFFGASQDVRPNSQSQLQDTIEITTHPLSAMVGAKFRILKCGDEAGTGHHQEAYALRIPRDTN